MTTRYKIEYNVPIPDDVRLNRGPGRTPKYPFGALAVNDSFFVDDVDTKTSMRSYYAARLRYPKFTFVYAYEGNGVRFWRIA